jgi:peptidoglycan/xylan/chitin deacetylase (PgdA/CDA1 family)
MTRLFALRAITALACVLVLLAAGPAGSAAADVRPCSNGLVALTFDDGPSTRVTGRLLDVLVERRVPATFFVVGERVAAAPWLVRRAHRSGFVIANHSYRHEMLTRLSDDAVRSTLRATNRLLRDIGVPAPRLMRPPYGLIDRRVRSVVEGLGMKPVLWDVDVRDWEPATSTSIAARVLRKLRPDRSNVVLLHDGVMRSPTTLRAVPTIVREARQRGYCFAELGRSGRPVPPVPTVRVSDAVAVEPGPGDTELLRFTLRLDRPTSRETSVRVRTVDGSAHAGSDYRQQDLRLRFPVGVTERRVTVRVTGDRVDETSERLLLRLADPRGLRLTDRDVVGVVRDDDPTPRLRLGDVTVTEPAEGSVRALVPVTLDRPSSRRVVLELATAPVSADASDYVGLVTTLTLEPGSVRLTVPVEVLADTLEEPAETFEVRVRSVSHGEIADGLAVVTIHPPAAG